MIHVRDPNTGHWWPSPNDLTGRCRDCGAPARAYYDGTLRQPCTGATTFRGIDGDIFRDYKVIDLAAPPTIRSSDPFETTLGPPLPHRG